MISIGIPSTSSFNPLRKSAVMITNVGPPTRRAGRVSPPPLRGSPFAAAQMVHRGLDAQDVTVRAESAHLADGHLRDVGTAPERLPAVNVRQVHVDGGNLHRRDGVSDGDARVRVRRGVDDKRVVPPAGRPAPPPPPPLPLSF